MNRLDEVKSKDFSSTLSLLLKPVKEMSVITQNLLFLTPYWGSVRSFSCKFGG